MVNRFLRTAPTRTLLAAVGGLIALIAGGTAIALAAHGAGPVPKPKRLAAAVRGALTAPQVSGISADISFTNGLLGASELQGTDPLLQGGNGHVWVSSDGRFRLELYGDNGDPEIVVNKTSWWISDPTLKTVYEGTIPARKPEKPKSRTHRVPSVAQIQAELNRLAQHLRLSGAAPSDVGGQPTYTVTASPKQAGGLLGQLQLAWDAARGVPLRFAVFARGDSKPVLQLTASNISYSAVDPSVFSLSPPAGYNPVQVATPSRAASPNQKGLHGKRPHLSGIKAVSRQLGFNLVAPAALAGMSRQSVSLIGGSGHRGALLVYGQNLGAIAVIEQPGSMRQLQLSRGSGEHQRGLSLPTFSVKGTTAQELDTALGTFVRFTSGGVTYTVIGSVRPEVARAAARGL